MFIIFFSIPVFLGYLLGKRGRKKALSGAEAKAEKYRQVWLECLRVLEGEGKITPEQYQSLSYRAGVANDEQRMLHALPSGKRAELEILRAHNGQPPLDDLKGMVVIDIARVREERTRTACRVCGVDPARKGYQGTCGPGCLHAIGR